MNFLQSCGPTDGFVNYQGVGLIYCGSRVKVFIHPPGRSYGIWPAVSAFGAWETSTLILQTASNFTTIDRIKIDQSWPSCWRCCCIECRLYSDKFLFTFRHPVPRHPVTQQEWSIMHSDCYHVTIPQGYWWVSWCVCRYWNDWEGGRLSPV